MSYYLFSAELPSAVLRSTTLFPLLSPCGITDSKTVKTGPFTFLMNSIMGIATW